MRGARLEGASAPVGAPCASFASWLDEEWQAAWRVEAAAIEGIGLYCCSEGDVTFEHLQGLTEWLKAARARHAILGDVDRHYRQAQP